MTFSLAARNIRGILLDVEGTTTPIAFVWETLFPFARTHVSAFLNATSSQPETQEILRALKHEHEDDRRRDLLTPDWADEPIAYINFLMDMDRKSTALKALQGKIWQEGYHGGKLRGQVFPDVQRSFKRWHRNGIELRIFSSGSVLAQRLLFSTTTEGDLTPWIQGYFDTKTGAKNDPESYSFITGKFGLEPQQVLFISDMTHELDAAHRSGMATFICLRPGNQPQVMHEHKPISSFDEIGD